MLDPFVYRLQEMLYRERSLDVGETSKRIQYTPQSIYGWAGNRTPPSLAGARKLVADCQDPVLAQAMVQGTGFRTVHKPPIEPQPLFYMVGILMADIGRLLELIDRLKRGTITREERMEARRIIAESRTMADQIEAQFDEDENRE